MGSVFSLFNNASDSLSHLLSNNFITFIYVGRLSLWLLSRVKNPLRLESQRKREIPFLSISGLDIIALVELAL